MGTPPRVRQIPTGKDLTTRLSPSSLRPVSLRYGTIKGHTPTMFATTSTRPGMDRSFVTIALRKAGREAIPSRVAAPFNRFTTNSVRENGSRLPKTEEAVRWRQRFNTRRSNAGYSMSFAWYPLPRWLAKASESTCGPPWSDTTTQDPDLWTAFFELDAAFPMTLHPTKHTSKNAEVHSI